MVADNTIQSFLAIVGKSRLVPEAKLLEVSAELLGDGARPKSPHQVAKELVRRRILTPWQADMLLQGKHRGFRLGPYRILRPLNRRGMNKVFLAEHEFMHRRSAIKILPAKYQNDAGLLRRFHLEAQALARLDHPNIVRVYDLNKDLHCDKELHYLVTEYIEGSDLQRVVETERPLEYRRAADYICQVALGLTHAHAGGFIHRDIKPANLLVDTHNVVKILDFGLATFTREIEKMPDSAQDDQSVVGTADYISPEQVLDSQQVDNRSDIYSLGLTFYFLLTGCRPFPKSTIMEKLMAHGTEQPESIKDVRPDLSTDLEAIIDKMVAKSPEHRYQTAQEVVDAIRKWQSESGSTRTYARLTALMAEAQRQKQSSARDITSIVSQSPANTELELELLDDE
jgi:eukaryotic-like serine/threonine-protein kinase